jgi:hypothetical protein
MYTIYFETYRANSHEGCEYDDANSSPQNAFGFMTLVLYQCPTCLKMILMMTVNFLQYLYPRYIMTIDIIISLLYLMVHTPRCLIFNALWSSLGLRCIYLNDCKKQRLTSG